MSQPATMMTVHDPAEASGAKTIYILYLVGLAVGVTTLIGVIMAYVNRAEAPAWVQSHYQFQIRTFWIGVLYGLIAFATTFVVIGFFLGLFVFAWWIVRCVKGLNAVSAGAPYPNPTGWLW